MIGRTGFLGLALLCGALSGCVMQTASVPLDSQRAQALLGMDIVTYFSTVSMATEISERCDELAFNSRLETSLNSLRNEAGRGSRAAETRQDEIMASARARRANFEQSYGVSFTSDDLCAIGRNEREAGTPIGTLLVPQMRRITG